MKKADNKIGETFSQMTASKAKRWYELKFLTASGYLLAIKEIMAPPGLDFTIPNVTKFCKEWGIPKSSFYKAINLLVQNGDISWEATEGVIIKSNAPKTIQMEVSDPPIFTDFENGGQPSQVETPVQNRENLSQILDCESHERDILSQIVDAQSHKVDSDIYIDRARVDIVDITNEVDKIHIQESARVIPSSKVEILEPEVLHVISQEPIQSESLVVSKVLHEGKNSPAASEVVMTLLSTAEPEDFPTRPNGKQRVFPWDKLHPTRGYIVSGSFAEHLSEIMKDWTGFKGKDLKVQARFVQNYVDKAQTDYQRFRDVCSYWDDYQEFTFGGKEAGVLDPTTGKYTSDPTRINILKGLGLIKK